MKNKYEKQNLEPIVKNSRNWAEVLQKLSMTTTGNSRKTLKKFINLHNIDISHFESKAERYSRLNINLSKFKKIPLSNILIENSTYNNTSNLKERLYKEGIKERKCELCGQGEEWNDKKMSLILDHINGINDDNRIENLRIVCPNCNATLETHCGKNKHKKNREKRNLNKKNIYVEYQKSKRKVIRPLYGQLLKEVQVLGFSATGRKYNVSDNAIRKWIKFYEKYLLIK